MTGISFFYLAFFELQRLKAITVRVIRVRMVEHVGQKGKGSKTIVSFLSGGLLLFANRTFRLGKHK